MQIASQSVWQRSKTLLAFVLFGSALGCSDPSSPETDSQTNVTEPAASNSVSLDTAAVPESATAVITSPATQSPSEGNEQPGQSTVLSIPDESTNNAVTVVATKDSGDSKSTPNPPLHLEEVLQRIDLRTFPFMEGNDRSSATIENYGFSAPVSEKFSVDGVMNYLDDLLVKANCVRGTDPSLEMRMDTGASRLYWHGDLMITASCGISRGSNGPDINSGIFIEGNVDLRSLPTPPNATSIQSKPDSLRLSSSTEIPELRKFFSEAMSELGWLEFRDYMPGVKIPAESLLRHQSFLKNGVFIDTFFYKSGNGEIETNVSVGILEFEPMLPNNAQSVKLRQDSPIAFEFETALSPHDMRAFYDNAYLPLGYSGDGRPTGTDDQEFAVTFKHPSKTSLKIEAQLLGESSIVVANETK